MAANKPQILTVVSCEVIPAAREEMTAFDVLVQIDNGKPFRLRTAQGGHIRLLHFKRGTSLTWVVELFTVGEAITVAALLSVDSQHQTPADGYRSSDRAVNPNKINPHGRQMPAGSGAVGSSGSSTAPVPVTIYFNAGGTMGNRAV